MQGRVHSRSRGPPARQARRAGWQPSTSLLFLFCLLTLAGSLVTIYSIYNIETPSALTSATPQQPASTPPPPPVPLPPTAEPPRRPAPRKPTRTVWWYAPFFSGGGMGVEAIQFVLGLQRWTEYRGRVWITTHGDLDKYKVYAGLDPGTQKQLAGMARGAAGATEADAGSAIIVCHSEPGAWALPKPLYQTSYCPPLTIEESAFVVARAMFESDRLSQVHVDRCNQMNEVWVPTEFHRQTFTRSGVHPSKLVVVPEPVDVEEFDPAVATEPLPLPMGTHVFGPPWPHPATGEEGEQQPFVFLSIFKWEKRKGWDVLLRAYLSSFTAADNVLLLLLTQPFHSDSNFGEQMQDWAHRELGHAASSTLLLPSVYVISEHIPQRSFPRLYRTADCFVLPTRGEGWGLPIVEAMAMGLPVIATNWSGPTAYLDESVGYPLRIEGLVDIPEGSGAFSGHRWAQPSVQHLEQLMRHAVSHRQEAATRGRAARQRMIEHYSTPVVAELVAQHLLRIEHQLAAGASDSSRG